MVKTDKRAGRLILLCSLVYFASYITRLDYAAVLVEMIQNLNTTKQIASIGVTGSFITYGLGMLISGFLGDKMPAKLLIVIGLVGSSIINLAAGLLDNIHMITVFWCFNGLFQAMIYPPLMRLMGDHLSSEKLVSGITYVTVAANVATVILYAVSPVLINLSGWRLVFYVATGVGIVITLAFLLGTRFTAEKQIDTPAKVVLDQQKAPIGRIIMKAGLIPILFAIIIMGTLRDGIQTWMPTYVSEVMELGSSASILTSVILPIFSVISVSLAKVLFSKVRNEMRTAFLIYAIGAVASCLLIFTFSSLPVIGVLLVALTNAAMHGTNLILISMVPAQFKKYGKISTFSGLVNAFVYVGAAISTYGIAVISDRFGWLTTIICWAVLAVIGATICLLKIKKWTRFVNE